MYVYTKGGMTIQPTGSLESATVGHSVAVIVAYIFRYIEHSWHQHLLPKWSLSCSCPTTGTVGKLGQNMQTSASVQPSDLCNCIARHPQAFPNRSPSKTLRQYLQSFLGPGVVLYFLRLAGWCGIHKGEDHIFIRAYLVAINKRNHNIHRCWTRCAVHGQVLQELLFLCT